MMHCDCSKTRIIGMRTNDLISPIGIDSENPVFSWKVQSPVRGWLQTAYRLTVRRGETVVWDSGRVEDGRSVGIVYAGAPLAPSTAYTWALCLEDNTGGTVEAESAFETGLPRENPFGDAVWISCADDTAAGLPVFRRAVEVGEGLVSARLYTSGLGVYEAYINGVRIGRRLPDGTVAYDAMKPGFTEMAKRKFYNTYDVTDMLTAGGKNALSAVVSHSWWSDKAAAHFGKADAFLAKLILTYADGRREVIDTDTAWRTARAAATVTADIFNGETYDARIIEYWRDPAFDDSAWPCAVINTEFTGTICAWMGSPITVRRDLERPAESITIYAGAEGAGEDRFGKIKVLRRPAEPCFVLLPGETALVDFGQNFAGREAFTVEGGAGTVLTVRHGEILNDNEGLRTRGNDGPEGAIYNANYRSAKAITRYILGGRGIEQYSPAFTFYGFRYAEFTADRPIVFHAVSGQVLTSVECETGTMTTSDPAVNQLVSNIRWGQYSNYLSIPTDCPQRDERQGWTADTQVFARAGCYLAFSKSFLDKFTADMRDSQNEEGAYPGTSPTGCYHGAGWGGTGWGDAGVILPHLLYRHYGDPTIITENWASMQKYVDGFLAGTDRFGPRKIWGDWLAYESNDAEIQEMLGVAFYAWDARMMAEMADVIGRTDDAARYRALYDAEKAFFMEKYVAEDGGLVRGEQSVCAYALYLDLLPDAASTATVRARLIDNITRNGNRLQTGFLGTAILMHVLTAIGRTDLAYSLLLQHENPSWLYSVDQGATTIWERWNSYTRRDGFGDVGMNSFNHYAYGSVAAWMFDTMAGITPAAPGFKRIRLAPQPDRRLTCRASYDSAYGIIRAESDFIGDRLRYRCTLPANTTAEIRLPAADPARITVNARPLAALDAADGITFLGLEGSTAVFEAAAGSYDFLV